jgi:hypothetical protein
MKHIFKIRIFEGVKVFKRKKAAEKPGERTIITG